MKWASCAGCVRRMFFGAGQQAVIWSVPGGLGAARARAHERWTALALAAHRQYKWEFGRSPALRRSISTPISSPRARDSGRLCFTIKGKSFTRCFGVNKRAARQQKTCLHAASCCSRAELKRPSELSHWHSLRQSSPRSSSEHYPKQGTRHQLRRSTANHRRLIRTPCAVSQSRPSRTLHWPLSDALTRAATLSCQIDDRPETR